MSIRINGLRIFVLALVASLFLVPRSAFADLPKVMPLADLKYGTQAIGFSVFRGVEPEPFDVILGNAMDYQGAIYILIRISGTPATMDVPLEKIGGIAGMSGSPIFIGCSNYDECITGGVLVGALSLSIGPFIEGGMNAAMTPAVFMLGAKFGGYEAVGSLAIGGNSLKGKDLLIRDFSSMGLGSGVGVGKSADCAQREDKDLKPGSMISIFLAKGDMPVYMSGTVTWRDGNKIYAFGHPMFSAGWISYPFSQVSVSDTVQTSYEAHKITGCSVGNEGTLLIDGSREVGGIVGQKAAPMIPLKFNVWIGKDFYGLNEEVVPNSPYTVSIINMVPQIWLKGLVGNTSRLSLAYQGRIVYNSQPEIFFNNTLVAGSKTEPMKVLWDSLASIYQSLDHAIGLSGANAGFDKFEIDTRVFTEVKTWKTEKVFWQKEPLSQTNTKAVPGETLVLTVILKEFNGGKNIRIDIPVTIPEDFLKDLSSESLPAIKLVIQGGGQFEDKEDNEKSYESPADLIGAVNEAMNRFTNTIYIQKFSPEKVIVSSGKKTKADPGQTLALKWQVMDPEDAKAILPRKQIRVDVISLPPLDGFVEMNQTMVVTVHPKPDVEPKETKKKSKKFLWIFPRK